MNIPESLLLTHCIATISFLVATLVIAKLRKVIHPYLATANSIAAALALVNTTCMIVNLIIAWEASPDHMFFKYRSVTFLPLIVIYVAAISLTLLKKLRATVLFSLILIIVYACLISNTMAYLIIYTFNPGALSVSWSYPWPESSALLFPLPAAAIYSVICYHIAKRIHARQNH
ncbi:hypothetical protein [Chitinophaga silvisoli]|nr:hypothetical protein [Chitinophaga silvisoli]